MSAAAASGVLGLWDGHDASVALVSDGELVFALSEERVARCKRQSGFPAGALEACLRFADHHGVEISRVAVAGRWGRAPLRLLERLYARGDQNRDVLGLSSTAVRGFENVAPGLPGLRRAERWLGLAALRRRLARQLGREPGLHTVEHHEAHAWSASLGVTGDPALVVTWDAYGEGVALTARPAEAPWRPELRHGVDVSLARLYGAVTQELGFGEGDEGKVMALAAKGDPGAAAGRFESLFELRDGAPRLRARLGRGAVRRLLGGLSREDSAAALQLTAEQQVSAWIRGALQSCGAPRRLLLAGGLFANIRVNQVLAAMPEVSGLFVFPNMTDGGLSAGAACLAFARSYGGALVEPVEHVFLGPEVSDSELRRAAEGSGLSWRRVAEPERDVAAYLREGRVVCRYAGRDEFGPRALGNRSILFEAGNPRTGRRVNAALGRDDFMPFGPVLRAEDLGEVSMSASSAADLAWMTIAVDATERFREQCPGAVHVDGTARPQVVSRGAAPEMHRIMSAYREAGGGPAVVNTSFNLHGEPIVHTAEDAVRTFKASGLDVLMLGDIELVRADPAG